MATSSRRRVRHARSPALEIIAGVVLFLFAFAEIASYDPEAEQALDQETGKDDPSGKRAAESRRG